MAVREGLLALLEHQTAYGYQLKTQFEAATGGAWWETVPGDEPPPRDELTVKVLLAIAHSRKRGLEVITQQRNALFVLLQQRQRASARRPARGDSPLGERLVHDALIVRAEADLRWLDLCEERVTTQSETTPENEGNERGRARGKRKGRV